jgi:hypothetical protein
VSDQSKEFGVGLALAGAISAGAYTGGVLDFLFQALEEWEKARGAPDVPQHRTGIKVIAGASAGAITGALGLVALSRDLDPQTPSEQAAGDPRCVLPTLYTAWVVRPRMVGARVGDHGLLSLDDLEGHPAAPPLVSSLLNSTLLADIATEALNAERLHGPPAPKPYLAHDLHLYMTVSNLRGIPFTLAFGENSYGMQTHGDRVHYKVRGLGSWDREDCDWLARDSVAAIDVNTLPRAPGEAIPPDWEQFGIGALASSAFPIGLASRPLATTFEWVENRSYPLDIPLNAVIKPRFPAGITDSGSFRFLNVDGGLINNNPYDYAEYALLDRPGKRLAADPQATRAAVIMVAPFPEPPAYLPEGQPRPELVSVIRALMPTLTTQARFRPNELAQAMDPHNYSRYLIAPRRVIPGSRTEERFAIASGLLGGFGGFLDEAFRAHDYQLGRRNCQRFLSRTFALPIDAAHIDTGGGDRRIAANAASNTPEQAPVIPLCGKAIPEVALPAWPRMRQADFETLMTHISARLAKAAPIILASQTRSKWLGLVGRVALLFGKRRILSTIRWAILADLIRRDQIEGWVLTELPPEWGGGIAAADVREVLAELAAPSFDYRTMSGIALSAHLPPESVGRIIDFLRQHPSGNLSVVAARFDNRLLTLAIRQNPATNLPLIGSVGRYLDPPQHDPF